MPNSNTLNLLSDSTFGDKLDEQNAILEDIRDNMGGGGDAASAGSIATIETSPAATAHIVGEYIYYNTKLYKVIAAIALGDTLTVGTNIAETKVMDEIPSVTNSIASGNTDVPTSEAVYNAIQGAGLKFVTFNDNPTNNDDAFFSINAYTENDPVATSSYYDVSVHNMTINKISQAPSSITFQIWLKRTAFNFPNNMTIGQFLEKVSLLITRVNYNSAYHFIGINTFNYNATKDYYVAEFYIEDAKTCSIKLLLT